jgi:anti-sigma B factor antagonist
MRVTVSLHPGVLVGAVIGRFDAHGIEQFDRTLIDAVDTDHPNAVIDLSQVEFMDSSALAGLVRALKATVACGGSVILVDPSDAARIILELTRLDAVFAITASMADPRVRTLTAA